jgi:hypothetical protein
MKKHIILILCLSFLVFGCATVDTTNMTPEEIRQANINSEKQKKIIFGILDDISAGISGAFY